MANISFPATTTTQVLPIGNKPKILHITNMGVNPVTIRFAQDGNAVFGVGVVLPSQYSAFSFDNRDLLNYDETGGATSVISSGGNSDLAIFYI